MSHFETRRTDATLDSIEDLAGRIVKILKDHGDKIDAEVQEWLDDVLGAIYAVRVSVKVGYVPKFGPTGAERKKEKLRVLRKRSNELAAGKIIGGKNWVGGFQLNNAMFRVSATLDRGLRIALSEPPAPRRRPRARTKADDVKDWYLKKTGHPWHDSNAQRLREEVNDLKHHGGQPERKVGFEETVAAIGELLYLVEAKVNP